MGFYPAFLELADRLVVLVGGGQVAARKLAGLLAAGARVRLVAPELHPEARALAEDPRVERRERPFAAGDLAGAWLAVSATDDEAVNRMVAAEAQRERVFVNVVDVPELCGFIVPAVVKRGDLCLAVSTGGASPAAAAGLRRRLEGQFGPEWEPYLAILRAVRRALLAKDRPAAENRPLFAALAESDLLGRVAAADWPGVDAILAGVLGPGFSLAGLAIAPPAKGSGRP